MNEHVMQRWKSFGERSGAGQLACREAGSYSAGVGAPAAAVSAGRRFTRRLSLSMYR